MRMDRILENLKRALERPLPGRKGQQLMAPSPLEESRFIVDPAREKSRLGAVLFLIYPSGKSTFVPMIKRNDYPGLHSGQIAFPGGKWEELDWDLSRTAIRETQEELGVDGSKIQILGKLSDLYIPASNFLVSPFLGFLEETPIFYPDSREVARIIECSFLDLLNKNIRKRKVIEIAGGNQIEAPYFEIENEVVWGATAMIISELIYLYQKQLDTCL